MAFQTSINIKFDIGNLEFMRRYIPTPSHVEALRGIIEGFIEESPNHSHIIVGPYGTGKSLLANIINTVVSKMATKSDISDLVRKLNQVDDDSGKKIKMASKLNISYVPILLNGNEGRFRQSIVSNIVKKLREHDIDVVLPGLSKKIIDTINFWKLEYPETFNTFVLILENDRKTTSDKWMLEVKRQNHNEIKYFSEIYPYLTAGASFDVDYDYSFISQMEYLISIMQQNNLGVFIVYDEFARFLQGLGTNQFNEAMQDIQDLAELSNRSKFVHFLLITHKSLLQYFKSNDGEYYKEFQRIEKRFRQYLIKSDQATFLRIAEIIISENINHKPLISGETFIYTQRLMRKYPLFPSINQTERDALVIRGMYPLHPVALFLLPSLTQVFGQNERTLFTFLESQETGGLINHISKSNEYYLPHQLFDFFFSDSNAYVNEEFADHMLLYKKAIARLPGDFLHKQLAVNVIKIITLWNLCAMQNEQKLTTDLLLFATQINDGELSQILSMLSLNKIARFNRINQYWELFSGNSIDLNHLMEIERQKIKMDKIMEQNILRSNLSKKYYLPEQYNDEKGMTRFAEVKFVYAQDILENSFEKQQKSDLSIYYVLPNEESETEMLVTKLKEMSKQEDSLFFLHSKPIETIKTEILNLVALESLRNNKNLLAEDKGVKEEIGILMAETKYVLDEYLSEINNFEIETSWFVNGEKNKFVSELEINSVLTEKCYRLYNETPVILNDSFNRRFVSGVQKNAAIQLIDHILTTPQYENFGIVGNGPEYALFASIFKNNERLDENVNNFDYTNIRNKHMVLLRRKLINILENNDSGSLIDIVNLFVLPPFGIRKPLVPILLVALLRDRWNEFMLYRNDMFVPGINGTKLFEIIVEVGAEKYQYVYESIDQNHIDFFNKIENYFRDTIENRLSSDSRLIYTAGTLLKWLRSLPRITQISEMVDENFRQLRDLIRRSEIQPQESIYKIFELYHNSPDDLLRLKQYGESYNSKIIDDLAEKVFNVINVKNYFELKNWVNQQEQDGRNKLVESLHSTISYTEGEKWISRFAEKYIGIEINEWSETTYNLFINQLNYDFLAIQSNINHEERYEDCVIVQVENNKKLINKVDLSIKSNKIYENIERIIINAGKNVPRQEIEYLVYRLFENYAVKSE